MVFGDNFESFEDDTSRSTTSGSWVECVSFTTQNLPAGTYRIGVSLKVNNPGWFSEGDVRVQWDDVDEILMEESTTRMKQASAFRSIVEASSGIHTIDVDFRAESGTIYVEDVRIEIWRVA
jgi:hypothetical protein